MLLQLAAKHLLTDKGIQNSSFPNLLGKNNRVLISITQKKLKSTALQMLFDELF